MTSGSAPGAGKYEIRLYYIITGAAETAAQNVQLAVNGVTYNFPTAGQNIFYSFVIPMLTLNGVNTVRLITAANAAASTVYTGNLQITRIG